MCPLKVEIAANFTEVWSEKQKKKVLCKIYEKIETSQDILKEWYDIWLKTRQMELLKVNVVFLNLY